MCINNNILIRRARWLLATCLAIGCIIPEGGLAEETAIEDDPYAAMLEQVTAAIMGGVTNTTKVVDVNALIALLPHEVAGGVQTNLTSQSFGAFGLAIAQCQADYLPAGGGQITIKISDTAGVGDGLMSIARESWLGAELDMETEDGFDRTTEFRGMKAYEQYSKRARSGLFNTLAHDRFMVEIQGHGVTYKAIEEARDGLDFDTLSNLAATASASEIDGAETDPPVDPP